VLLLLNDLDLRQSIMMAVKEDVKPPNGASGTTAKSTGTNSMSPLRQRHLGRASPFAADLANPRRSSNMSGSVDDARQSILSSTDDLLFPRVQNGGLERHQEPSHWHSAPLAMALLPALGGLLFQNGSAVVTDLTLLGLAAVLLNWSVRLPWYVFSKQASVGMRELIMIRDWYRSAQSIRPLSAPSTPPHPRRPSNTILEEGEESPNEFPTPPELQPPLPDELQDPKPLSTKQRSAASELRIHEILALIACFLSPALGAFLLHHIRSQLSRPSEGLVSNYNLTIFLLASELRPLIHLVKMVQARTLFLQRHLSPSDIHSDLNTISPTSINALTARLDELETYIASSAPKSNGGPHPPPPPNPQDLLATLRKSLSPDIEALNRAVRRYEKRATLLSMQTESRLADLEARMGDAITLAAAAERGVSNFNRKSTMAVVLEWGMRAAMVPVQLAWVAVALPMRVVGVGWGVAEGYVGAKVKKEVKTATGKGSGDSGRERRREKGRGGKKIM